jgi:hypothetical protein
VLLHDLWFVSSVVDSQWLLLRHQPAAQLLLQLLTMMMVVITRWLHLMTVPMHE